MYSKILINYFKFTDCVQALEESLRLVEVNFAKGEVGIPRDLRAEIILKHTAFPSL